MNKSLFSFLVLSILLNTTKAQVTVHFDNINLGTQGFDNGSNLSGGIQSDGLFFKNNYNTQFASWDGFAASSKTDTTTSGYTNQYSSFAGNAFSGANFVVVFESYSGPTIFKNANIIQQKILNSIRFTNSTYAGLSMKNGDAVSKKFGGISGNDPDFFKLWVFNHFNGVKTDSAEIFLADFRFSDNSQDYIVKKWSTANFNFSSPFDSVSFRFQSSDNGQFGMNTPAYICLDDIQYSNVTSVADIYQNAELKVFPNPFQTQIEIVSHGLKEILMRDHLGRDVKIDKVEKETGILLRTEKLVSGVYFVSFDGKRWLKVVKN